MKESRSEGPTVTAKHSQQDSEEDRPKSKGVQREQAIKKKCFNMENAKRENKKKDEKEQGANKGEPWLPFRSW